MNRRQLLTGLALSAAQPAHAAQPGGHALPRDPAAWLAYEARLRARSRDAGGGAFQADLARQVLTVVNKARPGSPLRWSDDLAFTAQAHAADLASKGRVDHVDPQGFDPTHRLNLLARSFLGSASENIAVRTSAVPPAATDVLEIWRGSPPHWTDLRRPVHAIAGFGAVRKGERTYVVGLLGRANGRLAEPLPLHVALNSELERAIGQSGRSGAFHLSNPATEVMSGLYFRPEEPDRILPGLYQLRPIHDVDARRFEHLWGPIFVTPDPRASNAA